MYEVELYHHGIKGQKWGVRRFQNKDGTRITRLDRKKNHQISAINSMYDHSNKWSNRKADKLAKKGKTAKAAVMKEMVRRNENARSEQVSRLQSVQSEKELKRMQRRDLADWVFGGQDAGDVNFTNASRFLTRKREYDIQRGMRWTSNWTRESTLARMTPEKGYDYLRRKYLMSEWEQKGYDNGYITANRRNKE